MGREDGCVGWAFSVGERKEIRVMNARRGAQSNWKKSEGDQRRDRSSQFSHLRPLVADPTPHIFYDRFIATQILNHHLGSSISEYLCQLHPLGTPISDHPSRINYPSETNHPSVTIRFRSITRLFRSSVSDQSWETSDQQSIVSLGIFILDHPY